MTGPHPAVAATRTAVRRCLAGLPAHALVLVACSGGPDSLALAAATAFVAPRVGLRAGAVCVDHGLQRGSGAVSRAAAGTCAGMGLDPVLVVPVEVGRQGGLEAAARDARLAALTGAAERLGAACVLLGHTLDDQAETVLLGLARGSGARSLSGMPAARGIFRRPLLGVRRADTHAACEAMQLTPWADPTNLDRGAQRRAAVRHDVVPALEHALGPGVVPALARTAGLLREDADLLDRLAADLLGEAVVERHPEGLDLDLDTLAGAPGALRGRALRAAALGVGSPAGALAAVHVAALDALVVAWHGQGPLDLPGGISAARRCGRLTLRVAATRDGHATSMG